MRLPSGVLIAGPVLRPLSLILRAAARSGAFDELLPDQRNEVLLLIGELEESAATAMINESAKPVPDRSVPASAPRQAMRVQEVSELLGVSEQRVRQLAPSLGGVRGPDGSWLLDRDEVLAERRKRRGAA
ncbi:hypothetical protein PP1_020050 [Pseudonocardia sp. P1]